MQGHPASTTISALGMNNNHINIKQKYNSIDIGYDDQDFDETFNQKKTRTNTNISSQKRIIPNNDIMRMSVQSVNQNIYQQPFTTANPKKIPGRQKNNFVKSVAVHNQDASSQGSQQKGAK